MRKGKSGADGDRTRNLQNAILARSQLRHGPNASPHAKHEVTLQTEGFSTL